MSKTTRATIKKFIKENKDKLYIKCCSDFDGMVDCVMPLNRGFSPVEPSDLSEENTLGIRGLWLVGSSRDYFQLYTEGDFVGYSVSNCCGEQKIAIKGMK